MLQYNVVPRKNPITKEVRYYAQLLPVKQLAFDDLCERIAHSTTATAADVHAVIEEARVQILAALLEGKSVSFGKLGSFYLTAQSAGSATADTFKTENIKRLMVRWTRPTYWRKQLTPGNGVVKLDRAGK